MSRLRKNLALSKAMGYRCYQANGAFHTSFMVSLDPIPITWCGPLGNEGVREVSFDHVELAGDDHFAIRMPDWLESLDVAHHARKTIITTQALKVRFLNTLRDIVGVRCPKNALGAPLVSDYDLIDASAEEVVDALLKIVSKP